MFYILKKKIILANFVKLNEWINDFKIGVLIIWNRRTLDCGIPIYNKILFFFFEFAIH